MADVEVARLTARDATKAAFDSVSRNISNLEGSAGKLRTIFAGLGAGLSAGAFVGFVRSGIDAADAIQQLSERTGIATERLSALQYAAKLSDVSTEQLATGLNQLNKAIATNSEAFSALGVSTNGKSPDEVLNDVAVAFSRIEDPAKRNAAALEIFKKTAFDLTPLLNALATDGLGKFADEAQRAGLIISGETARAADEFNDNIDRLKLNLSGLSVELAGKLLPSLNTFTAELIDGVRIFGSFSSALYNIGVGVDPFKSLTENLKLYRSEVERLASIQKGLAANGGGDSKLFANISGQLETAQKRLEFLKSQQRATIQAGGADTLDARDRQLQAPKTAKIAFDPDFKANADKAAAERKKAAEQAKREADQLAKFNLDNDRALAEDRRAVAEAYGQVELEQQKKLAAEKTKIAADTQSTLDRLLGASSIVQVQKLQKELAILAEAGANAPLEMQASYEQAFEAINVELQKAQGKLDGSGFKKVATDGTKAFAALQQAIEGWGRRSADVFADFVTGGKASFRDLIQSMIREAIALAAYQAVLGPIFGAIGGFFGGGGGGGKLVSIGSNAKGGAFNSSGIQRFAMGGLVTSPQLFMAGSGVGLMGEAGPEAIMPLKRGPDGRLGVQANGGGGGTFVVVNVDARSDAAYVRDQVRRGVAVGIAQERDTKRRGRD